MIIRPALAGALALSVLAAPLAADAQQSRKVYRIGILSPGPAEPSPSLDAFSQGLRELGYVEGRDFVIEYRWAEGKLERLPELAAALVRLKMDVLVPTGGTPAILAAKHATREIPIVFPVAADPVGSGLVASLARPGGNVTGFSNQSTDLTAKRLELMKEALPGVSRVAVLWNPANPAMVRRFGDARSAAATLGLTFQSVEVQGDPGEFERAFSAVSKQRPDALLVVSDAFTILHRTRVVELAKLHRLPTMAEGRVYVDAGALMSYGQNPLDPFRRAALYVDKILKGAKPADLPVEQPTKFELVINLKTAKTLGLTIPQSLLLRADEVIQ
ncbi:MAG: ABC transporter substrate-binding protein [Candidatus Rokubacteria bacterium]|nr:ABC transporter substrate-binding protein [Candidatus Rokubacteria bacterium]